MPTNKKKLHSKPSKKEKVSLNSKNIEKIKKNKPKLNEEEEESEEEIYPIEDKVRVGKYADAPSYLKDNELIKTGYLLNCHSVKLVLRSLFVFSNESINVWSHLIGAFIAIIFIFFTYFFVGKPLIKELSTKDFEELKFQVNETVIPWKNELYNHQKNEINNFQPEIYTNIDKIISTTNILISDYGTKYTIISKIGNFIVNINNYINSILKIFTKKQNSNVIDDITIKWDICQNKLFNLIKNDNDVIDEQKEKIPRWPLYIMLSAAIVCLGCSTTFHWFGIYSKKVFKFLSRLDYAGITFLIPGSCYPPYFYFYYCEKCKFYNFIIKKNNKKIIIYRDWNCIFGIYINIWIFSFCFYFNTKFSCSF